MLCRKLEAEFNEQIEKAKVEPGARGHLKTGQDLLKQRHTVLEKGLGLSDRQVQDVKMLMTAETHKTAATRAPYIDGAASLRARGAVWHTFQSYRCTVSPVGALSVL